MTTRDHRRGGPTVPRAREGRGEPVISGAEGEALGKGHSVDALEQTLTTAPPASNPRFPMVESLRAIAALSVLFFHVGTIGGLHPLGPLGRYVANLDVGVPLFFAISGFLLYRPFASARIAGTQPIRVASYIGRRARRILPAYWVALTVLTIGFSLPGVFTGDWWRYYGLVQIYKLGTFGNGMGVAWTLCIEVTFYLSLPLLDRAARWLSQVLPTQRRGAADFVMIGICAVCAISFQITILASHTDPRWNQNLLGTFDWFAVGMAIAVFTLVRPRIALRTALGSWIGAVALFVVLAWAYPDSRGTWWLPGVLFHVAYGAIAALLFLPATAVPGGLTGRVLSLRPLRWLGLISYSIYLYHATLIPFLRKHGAATWLPGNRFVSLLVAELVVLIPVAATSYYLVEAPSVAFRVSKLRARVARLHAPATSPQREPQTPRTPVS
jgi:acetyltransferase